MTRARIAYAIYLLSREGVVTTNYILNLRDYLDKNFAKEWQADLTGVYLAGALHILQKGGRGGEIDRALSDRPARHEATHRFLPAARRGRAICRHSRARISGAAEETLRRRIREQF